MESKPEGSITRRAALTEIQSTCERLGNRDLERVLMHLDWVVHQAVMAEVRAWRKKFKPTTSKKPREGKNAT